AGYDEPVPTIDDLLDATEAPEDVPAADESPAADEPPAADESPAAEAAQPAAEAASPPVDAAGLLDYLSGMASALPDEKRSEYMASEERLKLEYLRARLAGRPGLHRDGLRYAASLLEAAEPVSVPINRKRISDTLRYIGDMSTHLPDAGIGTALKQRVGIVLDQLRQLRETSV
ncbi:MAG: hypothetical protein ACOC2Q_04050, partial [Spirochaetota bacterium]